ncbi:MAG: thioredoxin family protein [Arachidicoccus sp.]|nr:thioredoxin family protein [Arachidicoccus sp.]
MRKILIVTACFFLSFLSAKSQHLIQFRDTVIRLNDSVAELQIHAAINKGTELFSTRKFSQDDAFVSSFTPDSSLTKYIRDKDSVTEDGQLQTANDTGLQATVHYFTDNVIFKIPLHIAASQDASVKGKFTWFAKNGEDFPSGEETILSVIKKADSKGSATSGSATSTSGMSLLKIFWIGLGVGLIAVFTPCVFPLIPVTVSFFLKRSKTRAEGIRNAITYSVSIILIYTIPTFVLTKIFGDTVMYSIATSAVSNIIFFIIFVVFAISFFGGFELTLPSSWATKADAKASKGGMIGIFFMALTLVIVSFSCTGPFIGSLLPQVATSNSAHAGIAAVMGILGLSVGLAVPFSLFAFFPSLLHALPKSGGWLNSVKVVFGFIELAMAMKFLSMVDLIYGWHLLDREVFLAIWIVLSILAGIYLLGKIKFSHDSDLKFVSVPRLFFAIIFLTFGVYLIPGMWGAPLKSFSGLLPPTSTQDFDLNQLQYKIENIPSSNGNTNTSAAKADAPKLYTDKLHMPLGLSAYFDFDEGMAAAKALNKPVMLDFTGHSCANCRKMENEVWSNPDVLKILKNDFVIISLYVDEPSDLPINQQYKDKNGKLITTLQDKNRDYELTKFQSITQPLYMFLDLKGNPLSEERYGYDPDIQKFINHLKEVKKKFEEEK